MINDKILKTLIALKDDKYKTFTSKLIPNINPDVIIGIRTPQLRDLAKKLKDEKDIDIFLSTLPHKYLEENSLQAYLIEQIKDYDLCVKEINKFLPYIDNWGTCDTLRPKCFKKNTDKLFNEIKKWIKSNHTYTIRFAIGMLMTYYLDNNFNQEHLDMVASVKSDEYYIKMMIAWYFATALAKQYDSAIVYLENNKLEQWTHNKTIQKAVESFRITQEQKEYLKSLRM